MTRIVGPCRAAAARNAANVSATPATQSYKDAMRAEDEARRKWDDLLGMAAAATNLSERSRLITQAVYWHAQAQQAERALEATKSRTIIPFPDELPRSDMLYELRVYVPGPSPVVAVERFGSAAEVLPAVARLLKEHPGCDCIEVHADCVKLFSVDRHGNTTPT